jgi:hypothetical protein
VISANIDAVDANGPTASNAPTAAVVAQRKRKAPRSLKGANAGRIDFSEYDVDFQITAPENSVELGELAWLDAITNLHAKIDEPFFAVRDQSHPGSNGLARKRAWRMQS